MSYEIKDFMKDIEKVEKRTGKAVLRRCTICGEKLHRMGPWGYNHMGAATITVLGFCEDSPEVCEEREIKHKGYFDGINCFVFFMPEDPVYLAKKLYFHVIENQDWTKELKMKEWAAENLSGWKYLPPPEESERLFTKGMSPEQKAEYKELLAEIGVQRT